MNTAAMVTADVVAFVNVLRRHKPAVPPTPLRPLPPMLAAEPTVWRAARDRMRRYFGHPLAGLAGKANSQKESV